MRGPFHEYANSKPTKLPTALSNITTGDSKYPQSSGVGGLWRREVFRRQWCVYLSSCGEPTTWHRLRAHGCEERLFRLPQRPQIDRKWSPVPAAQGCSAAAPQLIYFTHTPHASTTEWQQDVEGVSGKTERCSRELELKIGMSADREVEDIGRTKAFRTFKKTGNLMWHKINT